VRKIQLKIYQKTSSKNLKTEKHTFSILILIAMKLFFWLQRCILVFLPLLPENNAFTQHRIQKRAQVRISGSSMHHRTLKKSKATVSGRRRDYAFHAVSQEAQSSPETATTIATTTQPLLARSLTKAVTVALRCGVWCSFGKMGGLAVDWEASSNRNVALGRIDSLQIQWDCLSSPLVSTQDFQLIGKQLELGVVPMLILSSPILLFTILRSRRFFLLSTLLLLAQSRRGRSRRRNIDKSQKNTVATYRLGLSNDDLTRPKSSLLRFALRGAMDYLLRNSVVGALTESALAAAKVQQQNSGRQLEVKSPEDQMVQLVAALEENSTKLELQKVTMGDKGRLLLDAVAVFPDLSTGSSSRLEFCVRFAIRPLDEERITVTRSSNNDELQERRQPDGACGIMATNAELKVSLNKGTLGVPLAIFGRPIPDLWIPVGGDGIAFSFGRRHRVVSIETSSILQRIDVCGELHFNADAPIKENASWNFPFMDGKNTQPSLPPPPPLRPRLAPGKL